VGRSRTNQLVKMTSISQPYIGRQVAHFEKVELSKIAAKFSDDLKYRYALSLPFYPEKSRTKTASIILKNPSSADCSMADKTVQTAAKVLYMAFQDVARVEILNLFALRGTLPTDVVKALQSGTNIIGNENDQSIRTQVLNSDYVVAAWGGASPIQKSVYDKRIAEIYKIIAQNPKAAILRKAEKGSNQYPFHACYWPHNVRFIQIVL